VALVCEAPVVKFVVSWLYADGEVVVQHAEAVLAAALRVRDEHFHRPARAVDAQPDEALARHDGEVTRHLARVRQVELRRVAEGDGPHVALKIVRRRRHRLLLLLVRFGHERHRRVAR
jgi:hypothetical protein